jgi:hypothetical protein
VTGESKEDRRLQYIGVGCFTVVTGFFSGAMIAVLVGKFVGTVRRCTPPEGLPACDWHLFALVGGLIGAITLPFLAIARLRGGKKVERDETF